MVYSNNYAFFPLKKETHELKCEENPTKIKEQYISEANIHATWNTRLQVIWSKAIHNNEHGRNFLLTICSVRINPWYTCFEFNCCIARMLTTLAEQAFMKTLHCYQWKCIYKNSREQYNIHFTIMRQSLKLYGTKPIKCQCKHNALSMQDFHAGKFPLRYSQICMQPSLSNSY